MPNDNTDAATHPIMIYIMAVKALMGEKPPISIPQNSKGRAANANDERLTIVGERMANRLVRINGCRACH